MERSMSLGRPHVWPMPIHSFRPGDHACGGTCGSNSAFGISWKRWPNAEFLWHIRQSCAGSNAIRNSKSGGSASRARLGGPESYVKIKGRRTYLYRAVERAKRDVAAAKAFSGERTSRGHNERSRGKQSKVRSSKYVTIDRAVFLAGARQSPIWIGEIPAA